MVVQAWMRGVLLLGGCYNAIWAIFLFYRGDSYIKWITEGGQQHNDWVIFQAFGILLVGLLMVWSVLKPTKYKAFLLIAFFAKLFGGAVVYWLIMNSQINKKFIFHLLMNDIIWVIPLGVIIATVFSNKNKV